MANTSSHHEKCIPAIDGELFDLGCLGPALAIIFVLASLERRRKLKLEYCNGHPGLLVPVNFFSKHNRFTVAATFGATASTCADLFVHALYRGTIPNASLISLTGPPWLQVLLNLLLVFVYGILFYPFFACLATEYRLTGSILGFFYAVIRFSFKLAIDFQCISSHEGLAKNQTLAKISALPTYICLLFVVMRFAVLVLLEARKKWFQSSSDIYSAGQASETCLVRERTVKYVKQLLNPGLNLNVEEVRWFVKPIYFIYKSRADFEFSTQFISTLVVAAIIIFQGFVALQILYEGLKTLWLQKCSGFEICNDVVGLIFGSFQASCVFSAVISFLLILHFVKCHRDHVLQLYRGQRTFHQNVFASPARLLRMSLRFSGYQIASTLMGFYALDIFLFVFFLILGSIFKFPLVREVARKLATLFLPTIGMALLFWLFQLFLVHFVFRDRDFPQITFAVDNRRLFSIASYFFFFYNIVLGVLASAFRIIKAISLGFALLPRIDRTSLAMGFQKLDHAFVAYLGFVNVLVAHSHPVMLMFCQLLVNRNKDRDIAGSQPQKKSVDEHQGSSKENGTSAVYARELRIPRVSNKAVNRWYVTVTLLRNPSLITYRRQGGVTSAVDLGSIHADIHALV